MEDIDEKPSAELLEGNKYGLEKLKGLFPRNKNLLTDLSVSIVPSQYIIDFGNAQNFMMQGYRRHPKAKKINNNYFTLLVVPNDCVGALYGGRSGSPYPAMTEAVNKSKVAWPKITNLTDGSEVTISNCEELAEVHEGLLQLLHQVVQRATKAEDIKKAVDTTYDNFQALFKFMTDVDAFFKDTPVKQGKAVLQQGVDEVNRLLAEAEVKLNDLRMQAMKLSAPEEAEQEPDEPGYDMPNFDNPYQDRRQQEEDAQKNYDPIKELFAPPGSHFGFGGPTQLNDFY